MKPGDLVRNRLVYDRYEMGIIVKSGYCEYTGEEEVLVKWVHSKKTSDLLESTWCLIKFLEVVNESR